jgi:predicted membrane-bound mannosyltransferase
LSAIFIIWLLLFSSFFTHFAGLLDSVRTYLPWLKRVGGHSPHIHPWSFYLQRLAWFHPAKGPVWSEGLILILAAVGAVVSFVGRKSPLHRFLALYTIILTAIYSAISYKTPWCLLSFFHGMILLAGVGAAALVEFVRARPLKVVVVTALLGLTAQLSWQAWRASFVYPTDRRNPYVYAQTVPDLLNLVRRTEGLARVAPAGYEIIVKIIAPDSDYWPLPWYLRRFKHLGWYENLPDDPFSPIVVVSSKLDARLDEKSDQKWIMVGLTELRPGRFFEQYVELEFWKKYVETLPRARD